ncbi:hypothetical protein [Microbacterium sp. YY-01]|uniref:hypothetical protein n=1 Tax=Microbacterium sp. YY-01 TaxID=3421634 RepID=UPI003D18750F
MTDSEFAEALSSAIAKQRLSLSEIQRRLAISGVQLSVATLSYWRAGIRRPDPSRSIPVVVALENILQVAPGTLSGRISDRSRRLGSIGSLSNWSDMVAQLSIGSRSSVVRNHLGMDPENHRLLSLQEVIDVDENLEVKAVSTEILVQCLQGSVQVLGMVDVAAEPTETPPNVTVLAGGHAEGPIVDGGGTVFGYRLVLEKPLGQSETAMIEVRKEYPQVYPRERHHVVLLERRTRQVLQWYKFLPGHSPDWFDELVATRTVSTTTFVEPKSVHRSRVNFGPGYIRARWGLVRDT